jgi:hypothetical protein
VRVNPSLAIDDTLNRQFEVEAPDKALVTDITYIHTHERFAYSSICPAVRRALHQSHAGLMTVPQTKREIPNRPESRHPKYPSGNRSCESIFE